MARKFLPAPDGQWHAGPFSEGSDYVEGWNLATELSVTPVDERYYQPPGWYLNNQDYYDIVTAISWR